MPTELDNERLRFFSDCIATLRKQLQRQYEVPRVKDNYHWQWIYKPTSDKVYFEWKFGRSEFTTNLYFETDDSERNRSFLDLFRPIARQLETKLGEKLILDDEWQRGGITWARLYVSRPGKDMEDPALQHWAVEKARVLIEECEPMLLGDGRPHHNAVMPERNFPGELPRDEEYVEGAVSQVVVNRFERDPKARLACLEKFGYSCSICKMSFRERYGNIGDGFIHVHHNFPLGLRKSEYRLNPIKDLVPVCPNCHAMLHTSDPPLEIEELRRIWRENNVS